MPKKIDLSELFGNPIKQDDRVYSRPASNLHEFYLSGDIESPENYVDWFQTIRHAGQNDIIKIYINSSGGDAFTAIQFIRAIQESEATIIMSVEGICASAATMIFMQADSFEVSEYSVFMFHNYSAMAMGKGGELFDQIQHERKWSQKMLEDIYKDFLSPKEITSLLDNKDIWMDGEDVIKRLKKRVAKSKKDQNNTEADG
jgi:ATP-dependent protease ClpP protease subunit